MCNNLYSTPTVSLDDLWSITVEFLVQATVTVEMVSQYGMCSYINDILCISSIVTDMMVLVYVIFVIMMEYAIYYREICYVVNRSWHTVCCAV